MSPTEWSSDDFADLFDIDTLQDLPPCQWENLDAATFQESETPWTAASTSIDVSSNITSETNPFDIFDPREAFRSAHTPVTKSEMQGWMWEHLNRKNDSVHFDPSIKTILSTFINNFYGLATSLVDLLVDNAMSEAVNRDSDVVEAQDFTFIDFDLHASNINPVSAQIRYKLKDMRNDLIEKGMTPGATNADKTKKPTRKIPPQSSITKAVKSNNKKRKLSHRQEELSYSHSSAFQDNPVHWPAKKHTKLSRPSEAARLKHANTVEVPFSSSMGVGLKPRSLTLTYSTSKPDGIDSSQKLNPPYPDMLTSESLEGDIFPEQLNLDTGMQLSLTIPRLPSSTSMPPPQRIPFRFQIPCDIPFSSTLDWDLQASPHFHEF